MGIEGEWLEVREYKDEETINQISKSLLRTLCWMFFNQTSCCETQELRINNKKVYCECYKKEYGSVCIEG